MKTTNEILDKVRKVCGLHVEIPNNSTSHDHKELPTDIEEKYYEVANEIHLEHLLIAIRSKIKFLIDADGIILDKQKKNYYRYLFEKSVEQNLNENESLRELISNLIFE